MKEADISLTAIRALVAIGRQGSFTRAAVELGITQSAVSRHVANLERMAGAPLFERRGAAVVFTPRGLQFYDAVKDAIATIGLATRQLRKGAPLADRLRLRTSLPSFAMAVVAPLLGAYTDSQQMPVDVITSLADPRPEDEFDVLLSRDLRLPDSKGYRLVDEQLVCVATPALLRELAARPAAQRWPMIAARSRPDVIGKWAIAGDDIAERLQVGARFDHYFLAIAAAMGGAGLLVAPLTLVSQPLTEGTLVLADRRVVASGEHYRLYVNPRSAQSGQARHFCQWLQAALRAQPQAHTYAAGP